MAPDPSSWLAALDLASFIGAVVTQFPHLSRVSSGAPPSPHRLASRHETCDQGADLIVRLVGNGRSDKGVDLVFGRAARPQAKSHWWDEEAGLDINIVGAARLAAAF
jgi:hypothetical protein